MSKILLVDDDVHFSTEVAALLQKSSYSVETCLSGEDALQMLANFKFDLIILDNQMPGLSGLDVVKQFRELGGMTPIIFLSGQSASETKSAGLDFGADDYVVKPFDVPEFLARIRAVLRRGLREPLGELKSSGVLLDINRRTAQHGETTVQLTQTETNVLEFFLRNKDKFFSAQQVFQSVWPSHSDADEGAVRVLMHGLRRKFETNKVQLPIRTQKGVGYIVDSDQP